MIRSNWRGFTESRFIRDFNLWRFFWHSDIVCGRLSAYGQGTCHDEN
jgi:hypothetical protein